MQHNSKFWSKHLKPCLQDKHVITQTLIFLFVYSHLPRNSCALSARRAAAGSDAGAVGRNHARHSVHFGAGRRRHLVDLEHERTVDVRVLRRAPQARRRFFFQKCCAGARFATPNNNVSDWFLNSLSEFSALTSNFFSGRVQNPRCLFLACGRVLS